MMWFTTLRAVSGLKTIAVAIALTVVVGGISIGLSAVKRSGAMQAEFKRVIEINEQNLAEKERIIQALEAATEASKKAKVAVTSAEQSAERRIAAIKDAPKAGEGHTCALDSLVPSLLP